MTELERKARKHYIHFLKFTNPNDKNFDHAICYNGNLLKLLNVTFERWQKIKVNK